MHRLLLALALAIAPALCAHAQSAPNLFSGFLALGTGNGQWSEVSAGNGYIRQPITMGAPVNHIATNLNSVSFGPDTSAGWGTITEAGLYDAPVAGNLIAWWPVSPQPNLAVGASYALSTAQVQLSIMLPKTANFLQVAEAGALLGSARFTDNWTTPLTAGAAVAIQGGVLSAFSPPGEGAAAVTDSRIQTSTTRAPAITDSAAVPFATGADWLRRGSVYQLQDTTAGGPLWASVGSDALPLDTVGLYVSSATPAAAGSGYGVGQTITLTGGVVVTVASLSGTGVATVTVTNPAMMACAPTGAASQLATSGSGSGASFNLNLLYPSAYGTRLLTRCYSGKAMTVTRSDTGESLAIGFNSDHSLDTATLDGFTAGPAPMVDYTTYNAGPIPDVTVWNDQGGSGNNAIGAAASAPTLYPNRQIGNARSVMFFGKDQNTTWTPAHTFLTLPAGVSASLNNMTLVALGGMETTQLGNPAFLTIGNLTGTGYDGGLNMFEFGNNFFHCDNGGTSPNPGWLPTDSPVLAVCDSAPGGVTFDVGNHSVSSTGTGANVTVTGGGLGLGAVYANGGQVDMAAAIIIPWALPPAQRLALEAALYRNFQVPPQFSAQIVAIGDSHMDGYGTPFQDSWPRLMIKALNRNDISLLNSAETGAQLQVLLSTSNWNNYAAPNLAAYNGPKFVMLQGGYNDLGSGQTTAQLIATYQNGVTIAHASGAKAVCVADVIRDATTATNQQMQAVAAAMRNNTIPCDGLIDFQSFAPFNQASGPWPTPWFEEQDFGVHLSALGNTVCAEIAAAALKPLLP